MSKEHENTTKLLAREFITNALNMINGQLREEIKRNGFSIEKVQKGKTKIDRIVKTAESDTRFKVESFSINNRIIMAVKWTPSGFVIERNSDAVANAVKVNPLFGIKKNHSVKIITEATEREVEIEARANQIHKSYLKTLK